MGWPPWPRPVVGPGPLFLALEDLPKVVGREPDASSVEVERYLSAVRPRPQCALGHLGQSQSPEELGRLTWRENQGKP